VAPGGVSAAGALGLAAFHHPFQDRSLREVFQALEFALEFLEAPSVAVEDRRV
jgi:hypothetical protein